MVHSFAASQKASSEKQKASSKEAESFLQKVLIIPLGESCEVSLVLI